MSNNKTFKHSSRLFLKNKQDSHNLFDSVISHLRIQQGNINNILRKVNINTTNHDLINLKNSGFFNEKINIKGVNEESNILLGHIYYVDSFPSEFIQFVFQGPNKLESVDLTSNHLIYSANRKQFIQAKKLTLCDNLLYTNCEGKQVDVKLIEIKKAIIHLQLLEDIFVGNGILLSCYVSHP